MDAYTAQKSLGARARRGKQKMAYDHYLDKSAPRNKDDVGNRHRKQRNTPLSNELATVVSNAPEAIASGLAPRHQRARDARIVCLRSPHLYPWRHYLPCRVEKPENASAGAPHGSKTSHKPGRLLMCKYAKLSAGDLKELHINVAEGLSHAPSARVSPDDTQLDLALEASALLSDAAEAERLLRWQLGSDEALAEEESRPPHHSSPEPSIAEELDFVIVDLDEPEPPCSQAAEQLPVAGATDTAAELEARAAGGGADVDEHAEVAQGPPPRGPYVVDLSELLAHAAVRPRKQRQRPAPKLRAPAETDGFIVVKAVAAA